MQDIKDTFCVFPFYAKEIYNNGHTTNCCLLPTTHDITEIRKALLEGDQHPACSACWKLEQAGQISDRIVKNNTLDHLWDKDIRFIKQECQQGEYGTRLYKITPGNTCDAACVTCGSWFSSKWAGYESKMGLAPKPNLRLSKSDIDSQIDFHAALSVGIMGGEPTLDDNTSYILEKLLEAGNGNCHIDVLTNGREVADDLLELLLRFPRRQFTYSIDGIGKVFDYLRWPRSWHQIEANMMKMRGMGFIISSNVTVSNLNILYLKDIDDWMIANDIPYNYTIVTAPRYFSPSVLPLYIKEHISYGKDLISVGNGQELFAQFCQRIIKQDAAKGIDIRDYIPRLADIIDSENKAGLHLETLTSNPAAS